MFEAVRAFVRYALPTTWRLAPEAAGVVPIPMFEVATIVVRFVTPEILRVGIETEPWKLAIFAVPETFTLVAKKLVAVREFVK
jgi:hypothetical protein